MNLIELTIREHLSKDVQSSTEQHSEIMSFCGNIEEYSLNMKVQEALTFRKQGHFNHAMLNISEANRDQVIAIRRIQRLLGLVRGKEYPEVIFEKFRQFEPFEIGISDADAVLSILASVDEEGGPPHKENISKLHDHELKKKDEEDYLTFLENRLNEGSASEDIDKTQVNLASLAREMTELRSWILKKILVVVDEALKETPSGIAKDRIFLELSRNIFLVAASPILTKPATHVETEM